jgi:hypothetical protein
MTAESSTFRRTAGWSAAAKAILPVLTSAA